MKKTMMVLMAAALVTASVPVMAMEHSMSGKTHDEQCQKDCDMLVKNCGNEVDTLQQRIQKLETALRNEDGKYSREELLKLRSNLEEARKTLAEISGV